MSEHPVTELAHLFEVMAALRAEDGCPWDRAQTHRTLLPYLLEETYELIEAVEVGDDAEMAEELGDLLVEVAMHTAIASGRGAFGLGDVATRATKKMVTRHPHVFADTTIASQEQLLANWEQVKRGEKPGRTSALDGIPKALPALTLAASVQRRAARGPAADQLSGDPGTEVRERLEQLGRPDSSGPSAEVVIGELLFSVVQLAAQRRVDPEGALRQVVRRWSSEYRQREAAATDRSE
ncbi:MAG: MazG family protein [Candidatus Dormibacteria bacterium]